MKRLIRERVTPRALYDTALSKCKHRKSVWHFNSCVMHVEQLATTAFQTEPFSSLAKPSSRPPIFTLFPSRRVNAPHTVPPKQERQSPAHHVFDWRMLLYSNRCMT